MPTNKCLRWWKHWHAFEIYRFIHTKRATAKYAQRSKKGRATRKGMEGWADTEPALCTPCCYF